MWIEDQHLHTVARMVHGVGLQLKTWYAVRDDLFKHIFIKCLFCSNLNVVKAANCVQRLEFFKICCCVLGFSLCRDSCCTYFRAKCGWKKSDRFHAIQAVAIELKTYMFPNGMCFIEEAITSIAWCSKHFPVWGPYWLADFLPNFVTDQFFLEFLFLIAGIFE